MEEDRDIMLLWKAVLHLALADALALGGPWNLPKVPEFRGLCEAAGFDPVVVKAVGILAFQEYNALPVAKRTGASRRRIANKAFPVPRKRLHPEPAKSRNKSGG